MLKENPKTEAVIQIQESIPGNLIREKRAKEKLVEVVGLVTLQGLQFVWRAWPSAFERGKFYLLAPIKPGMEHILEVTEGIDSTIRANTIEDLYNNISAVPEEKYHIFFQHYFQDPLLRENFGRAVSTFCCEKKYI